MTYTYTLHRDINLDAWNWWDACNSINFGTNWSDRIDEKIAKKIKGKTKEEAYKFLIPYLKKTYQQIDLNKSKQQIDLQLSNKFQSACDKMAKVMEKPLYRPDFHFYITTFPSIPYDKQRGRIWFYYSSDNAIGTFLHELCHLQFIHYWRENPNSEVSKLSNNQFENLKECLTVIIDEEFFPLVKERDHGYAIHKELRLKMSQYWKSTHDFEQLISYSAKLIAE